MAVLWGAIVVSPVQATDDPIDRLSEWLTFSTANADIRARVSGTAEIEGYLFPQPAPAFISSSGDALLSPRITTFLDLQMGRRVYVFAQARADRGFDPGARHVRGRLDEYALRITPSDDGYFSLQVGKFATVVGNWVTRHGSWESPFITAPLVYENLTGIWDSAAANSSATLLGWSHVRPPAVRGAPATDKGQRLPVVWGPSYTAGASVSGGVGRFSYALEMKNASIASRPRIWPLRDAHFRHPTWSGRVGYRPNPMWNLGLSGSTGTYLRPDGFGTVAPGYQPGDYRQTVIAQDVSFAWHHLQVWAEVFQTRFAIPQVGDADTVAYFIELKRKITPQFFGAVRWNEQLYSRIPDGATETRWGLNVRRLDLSGGYRFTPHTQLKVQYSWMHEESGPREVTHLLSAQLMLRF
jgi:hypothetical protein